MDQNIHVKVDQNEGCAIWIIAIALVMIALMTHRHLKQLHPVPQQPAIQQEAPSEAYTGS